MLFAFIGGILLLLKVFEVGSFGELSWLWVIIPFAVALFYWEVVEPMFNIRAKKAMKQEAKEMRAFKRQQLHDIYNSGRMDRKYRVVRQGEDANE